MTRAKAYAEGFTEGRRWAEHDIREHRDCSDEIREAVEVTSVDWVRAEALGNARGYRDTFARYDAGTLTWEMFELAPKAPR